jgi:colanic acid/amylovoran biosynthesis glycosyltransferase
MILLLFATSYPYDSAMEQTFLSEEVEILARKFDRIILVPRHRRGNRLSVPNGVEVDTSFAELFSFGRRIYFVFLSLFSWDFYRDIKDRLPNSLSFSYMRRLFSFMAGARLTQSWVQNWLRKQSIPDSTVICYTYWFDEISMGIGLAKKMYPGLRVVSRTHGYDLYEEKYALWPCRYKAISLMDGLFADSDAGTEYLHAKYPEFKERYGTALLGVHDPGAVSNPSTDDVLHVVSCSMLNPIKRIDLLFDAIVRAARMRSGQKIEWRHFGDGDSRQDYIKRIANEFPLNASGDFPGYKTQADLIKNYLEFPVDVFVNVSSTEGTPVSIMEAVSCGIPVIATAVGGNTEIVSEKNGFLLNENPSPDEIAEALLKVCDQREQMLQKRRGSRQIWQERYNEKINFESFAERLVAIRKN